MVHHLDDHPTALYRLRDAAGQLLYVGITSDVETRLRSHKEAATDPGKSQAFQRAGIDLSAVLPSGKTLGEQAAYYRAPAAH